MNLRSQMRTQKLPVEDALEMVAAAGYPEDGTRIVAYCIDGGHSLLTSAQSAALVADCAAAGHPEAVALIPFLASELHDEVLASNRATSVYVYFDSRGRLIYVGVTQRGTYRQREHLRDKAWWHLVAAMRVEHYAKRAEALAREKYLIERYVPPFNTQHSPLSSAQRDAVRVRYLTAA